MRKYDELLKKANRSTLDKNILDKELLQQLNEDGISQSKIVKLFGFGDYEFRQLLIRFGLDKESLKNKYIDDVCKEFGEGVRRALLSCSYYERHKKVSNRKKEALVDDSVDIIENIDDYIVQQESIHGETIGEHLWAIASFENRASNLKAQADKQDCVRWATAQDLEIIRHKSRTEQNIVRKPFESAVALDDLIDNHDKIIVYGHGGVVWGYAVLADGKDNSLEILDFVVFYKELKYYPTPGILLKKIDEYANEKGVYTIRYKMDSVEGLDKSFKVNKYDFQKSIGGCSYLQKITSPVGEKYFAELAVKKEQQRLIEIEQAKIRRERELLEQAARKKKQREEELQTFRLVGTKLKGPESYVEQRRVVRDGNGNIVPVQYRSDIYKMLIVNQDNADAVEKMWQILSPQQLDTLLNIDLISNGELVKLLHISLSAIEQKMRRYGVARTFGAGLYLNEGEYSYQHLTPDEEYLQSIADQIMILENEKDK